MAIAVALVEAPVVAAAPMSYWRTVAWRLARDRATLVAGGVLALIVLSRGAGAVARARTIRPPARSGCAWRRSARRGTCSGRTSRGATC